MANVNGFTGESGISLCMIARDEEAVIGRCLSSVADVVTEIIVVDTGSSDRTREIARSFGATVVSMPWRGDFAYARNIALALAAQPWILVLDADEELVRGEEAPKEEDFLTLLSRARRDGVFGYNIRMVSFVGTGEEYVTDSVCRLFRNDPRIRFSGPLHEEVASSISRLSGSGIADLGVAARIDHYGYLDRVIAEKRKGERNRAILDTVLRRFPNDPYWLYALGTEHYQEGAYEQALECYARSLPFVPKDAGYLSDLRLKIAFAFRETGRRRDAVLLADDALRDYPDYPDLLELRAMLAVDEGEEQGALVLLSRAREAGDRSERYSSCSGSGTYRTLHMIGRIYERLGQREEAIEAYRRSLTMNSGYAPSQHRLKAMIVED
ncbi:glycosyltransferase [Cohnella endophytica]|nr:glycosyltransferase family 2 protein [Cohnella endophytica]